MRPMATFLTLSSRLSTRPFRFLAVFGVLVLLGAAVGADVVLDRSGRLEPGDPTMPDNSYYDEYTLTVSAGRPLTITLTSSDFDAYLKVTLPDGTSETNDDGAGNRNSRLTVTPRTSGTLRIQANSLSANEVGAYRLTVDQGAGSSSGGQSPRPTPNTVSNATTSGDVLLERTGTLEDGDRVWRDGTLYDEYTVAVRANERIQVRLESREFDAYLVCTLPGGREVTNDDGAGDRNSFLELVPTQSGTLRILANCISANDRGAYRLVVTRTASGTSGSSGTGGSTTSGGSSAIATGQWVDGRLEPGDETREDGSYQDLHRFEVRAGERVTVTVESDDFDAILWVTGPGSFSEFNDDAEGRNPRISATLPAAGTYTAIVNSFGAGATEGAYRIRIQRGSGTSSPAPSTGSGTTRPSAGAGSNAGTTLAFGRSLTGRLQSGDQAHNDGSYIDYYTFTGRAGQTVTIRLTATDFDPYLFLTGPNNFSESNDDADGEPNSRLTVRLPANGTYRVAVNSYGAGPKEGDYTLSLVDGMGGATTTTTPATEPTGARLQLGRTVSESLGADDGRLTSGEYRDVYTINLEAGQSVAVDLTAGDFDPYLFIRGPQNFSEDNDDYQGSSSQSRIEFQAPSTGAYRIYVTSYRSGEMGNYRLAVTDPAGGRTTATPSGSGTTGGGRTTALTAGASVNGRLETGDGTLQSGEYRDAYTYNGRAGERLTIEMTSSDLDAYLFIRGPQNFSESNDDAVEGQRDARLTVTLPANGTYQIYATSYRAGEEGAYRLSLSGGSGTPTRPTEPDWSTGAPNNAGGGVRVYGVFVGISDYPGSGNDLPLCAEDARKLAQVLRDAGVSSTAEQRVLVDNQATVANVRRAIQEIGSRCGPNDLFIFFYSGHGSQTEDMANSNERDRREESIVLYDNEIGDDEMGRLLSSVRARVQVIGLDACFSGGFRDALTRPEQMGLFSSEEDLTSSVADKFEAGGYLSHFLRTGLLGGADFDRNDIITAGELSEYLHRMYAEEVRGIEAETIEGEKSYQHIVIDRGGVKVSDMIVALRSVPTGLKFRPANRGNRPSVSGTSIPVRNTAVGAPAAVRGNTEGTGRANRRSDGF